MTIGAGLGKKPLSEAVMDKRVADYGCSEGGDVSACIGLIL
jgi:hypothetical protein